MSIGNKTIMRKQKIFADITYTGQSIEKKMQEVTEKNEPIEIGAEMIYTERKDGVLAGCDIRTDRFEIAIDAADKINAMYEAKNKGNGENGNEGDGDGGNGNGGNGNGGNGNGGNGKEV